LSQQEKSATPIHNWFINSTG